MDAVKFVPPGGHRACLSCSAAKAKCVFSDEAEVAGSDSLGFITGGPDDFINASAADMQQSNSQQGSSQQPSLEGTPAIPRCRRCERLNRDCRLPTRPRKKRRVGTLKPGIRAASTSSFPVAPSQSQNPPSQDITHKTSLSNLSTTSSHDPAFSPAKPARMPSMPNMRSSQQPPSGHNTPKRSPVTPVNFPYQYQPVPPQTQLPQAQQMPSIASVLPDPSSSSAAPPPQPQPQSQPQSQPQPQQHAYYMHNVHSMQNMHMSSQSPATMHPYAPSSPGAAATAGNAVATPQTIDPSRLRPSGFGSPSMANITPPRQYQTIPPPPPPPQFQAPLPPVPEGFQAPHAPLPTPQASHASQAGQTPARGNTPASGASGASGAPGAPGAGVGVSPPQVSALSLPGSQNPHQILIDSVFRMDEREAEELLRFYRDAYSSFNPYMEPPPVGMRVAELQAQKPLVWIGIVCVTSFHDFDRQIKLGRAIIFYATDRVFHNNVKTLDLLQGLTVFLNWFITQNFVLPQFTNLIHLAMALVTDLGLNKLEFFRTSDRSPLDQYIAKTIHGPGLRAPDEGHTLEERRALAGCYCLSHAMSDSMIMFTPLHYSLQLEDTCRFFEAAYLRTKSAPPGGSHGPGEAPAPLAATALADYHLAVSVRLHYLIARVLQVQRDADLLGGRFTIPVRQHIDGFTSELRRLWNGLPPESQSDFKIQLLYYTAEIYIFELSLSTKTTPFMSNSTPSRESDDGSSTTTYQGQSGGPYQYPQEADIPLPVRCYLSLKQFFDIFLTLPVNLYHQFPVPVFTQLVHADLTLAKLTAYFRGNTNPPGTPEGVTLPLFSVTIEAVASRFAGIRQVPHPLGYTVRNIIYDAFAARLRSFKVLDLSGRRKHAKAARKAAQAAAANNSANQTANSRARDARSKRTTPPTVVTDVLSISNLIGSVPRPGDDMQVDQPSSSPAAPPSTTFPSVEMDVEPADPRDHAGSGDQDIMHDIVVEDAMVTSADIDEMMEISGGSDDMDEEAEWWAWFGEFQNSLMGPRPGSTAGGSTAAGGSAAPPAALAAPAPAAPPLPTAAAPPPPISTGPVLPVPTPSSTYGGASGFGAPSGPYGLAVPTFGTTERRRGPASVASIDSLLNNRDQEPNLDTYIMSQGR